MILSAQSIRKRGIFTPFCEASKCALTNTSFGLSHCGYDIRLDLEKSPSYYTDLDGRYYKMQPQEFMLAATIEHFELPHDLVGIVHDKSSMARRGVTVQNTVIEPGWKGYLTLEITNHAKELVTLRHGQGIAQVIFHLLDAPTESPYAGKYQNQEAGPQAAR